MYKFSQQGWESLNYLIKRFFFLRTNKGGGRSDKQLRLLPIARIFQRRILWLSGLADKHLASLDDANDVTTNSNSDNEDDETEDENDFLFSNI